VDIVPSAVSDIRGSIVIYVRSVLEPGATSRMQALYADKQVEADAIALDDYCDEQGIDSVDLVQMDIEGGEIFAIEGMRRGLEQGRYKAIMLELHAGKVPPGRLEALLDLLRVSGLTVYEFSDTSVLPLAEGMPESSNYVMALSADTIAAIAPDGRIEALDIPRVF
ncbi:MAG: FkbM family methyltransferase, partial [Anaerolineae bacterium]|nr:FkbM family methyltransferase [Anaerolineae bacterium]